MSLADHLADLEPVLASPVRYSIVAALSSVDSATFKIIREALQISPSVLSKQIWALAEAGLFAVDKVPDGRVVVTVLQLTPEGRTAFTRHRRALESIAQGLDGAT